MIYLVVAPPGGGKTYFCTRLALEVGLKKFNRKTKKPKFSVFTNYPIVDKKTGYSTYQWLHEYCKESILDSTIIIDEAWMFFSSRNYKNFSTDLQAFFAMNRHNGNDIYIIAQNAARVDIIIREMVNELYFIQKHCIPFTNRPLWFTSWVYQDLNQMSKMTPDPLAYEKKKRFLFKKRVASAYDTLQYRTKSEPIVPVTWSEILSTQSLESIAASEHTDS